MHGAGVIVEISQKEILGDVNDYYILKMPMGQMKISVPVHKIKDLGIRNVMDKEKAEAEFGDVMFSLINAARLYKINPDNALELTNQKFIRRFNYLEEHTIKEGKNLKDMSLEEMDAIWNEAKRKGL